MMKLISDKILYRTTAKLIQKPVPLLDKYDIAKFNKNDENKQ